MLLCYFGTHVEKLDGEAALKECARGAARPGVCLFRGLGLAPRESWLG